MSEQTPPSPPQRPQRPPPAKGVSRLILGISLFGLAAMVGLTIGVVLLARDEISPSIKEGSFLSLTLNGDISDAPEEGGLFMDPKDFPPLVTEVSKAIQDAAKDERIKGLYLNIEGVPGGWAAAQEIHDAVLAFGQSGKPCYAYGASFDNSTYYVASACKEIYLAPAGVTMVNGLSITTEYYVGVFEKIGVKADFEHVGDFKSAVEPMQRTGPSDAAAEAMEGMIGELYTQMVAGIAAGRGLTVEQVGAWIDNPPITADAALAAGMITGIKYQDEVEAIVGEETTSLGDYLKSEDSVLPGGNKKIAIIHVDGNIVDGASGSQLMGGRVVGNETISDFLDDAREDEDVVAVILRVNSPGGSGLASDMMWRSIQRVKAEHKPVVVSMANYAASGGYYISAPADLIIAEPGTITGSIGVFGGKLNIGGVYEKVGITTHTWQRGQYSDLFSGIRSFSDPERAKFREFLTGFYDVFLSRVADGRHMTKEAVHLVAQGHVWTGTQAKERGLVDELGGLDLAITRARELAKVAEGEVLDIERLPHRKTFIEQIVENMEGSEAHVISPELAIPEVRQAVQTLSVMQRVLEGGGVAAMMPEHMEIH